MSDNLIRTKAICRECDKVTEHHISGREPVMDGTSQFVKIVCVMCRRSVYLKQLLFLYEMYEKETRNERN